MVDNEMEEAANKAKSEHQAKQRQQAVLRKYIPEERQFKDPARKLGSAS